MHGWKDFVQEQLKRRFPYTEFDPWVYMLETELSDARYKSPSDIERKKQRAKGHECRICNFVMNRTFSEGLKLGEDGE